MQDNKVDERSLVNKKVMDEHITSTSLEKKSDVANGIDAPVNLSTVTVQKVDKSLFDPDELNTPEVS